MLAKEFLIRSIPSLKPSDSGSTALSLMEEYNLKHLPVTEDNKYLFLLSEKDIFIMPDIEGTIENASIYSPYINDEAPILEVLRIMSNDQLTLLPVVNTEGHYMGAVTLPVLTEKMAELTNAGQTGALIALELFQPDYVLSEIVRLTEANNAQILSLFSYPVEATAKLIVLIKVDLEDASPVLRSLERFNYNILYYAQKKGLVDDVMKQRLDELMYYIKM